MEEEKTKRGVGIKVFGVSLIILGSLNLMLCWRGGLAVYPFYPAIMVVGIVLFIFGTLRGAE